jgi:hypothetical protein
MPEVARFWTPGGICRVQPTAPDIFRQVVRDPTPYPRPERELEGTENGGFHGGDASMFRLAAGQGSWFHFPVSTPVLLGADSDLYLDHWRLLWRTIDGAAITWATFSHGGRERHELRERGVASTGDHRHEPDAENTFTVRPRLKLTCGLQLSVLVEAGQTDGQVNFHGVGISLWNEPA